MKKHMVRAVVCVFALATFGAMSIQAGDSYRDGYMDGYDDGYASGKAAADTGNTNQPTCCGGSSS